MNAILLVEIDSDIECETLLINWPEYSWWDGAVPERRGSH